MFKGYHRIVHSIINTRNTYLLFLYMLISVLLFSCGERKNIQVKSLAKLQISIDKAKPGDHIIVTDGIYVTDTSININARGTELNPIIILAENTGGVTLSGKGGFCLDSNSAYIIIKGFIFNHSAEVSDKIEYGATHCRFTHNLFELTGTGSYLIVAGDNSEIDYNTFQNKNTEGRMLLVEGPGPESDVMAQNVWVHHNYFSNFENSHHNNSSSIQFGRSWCSMATAYGIVEYNLFSNCRGENENVAHKASNCIYRYNTFGPGCTELSLRHGNKNKVYGNYFQETEGIRIFGDDHLIFSNYFERNSRAIHLGNGQDEVADGADLKTHDRPDHVEIVYNTLVNNSQNFYMGSRENGLGATFAKISNNIILGGGKAVGFNGECSNAVWEGNIIWNTDGIGNIPTVGYQSINPLLSKNGSEIYRIQTAASPAINAGVGTYTFVTEDIDAQSRKNKPDTGADEYIETDKYNHILDISEVGYKAVINRSVQ